MFTVKEPIRARKTCSGQYNFQYPNTDVPGVILKPDTKFVFFNWGPRDNLRAISIVENNRTSVYWIDPEEVVDKCF